MASVDDLERRLTKLEHHLAHIDAAFETFRDVLIKIQNENVELRKNRDFLLEKHKSLLKKSLSKDRLTQEIREKLVNPLRGELREDAQLIRNLTKPEEPRDNEPSFLDELLVLVMNKGTITVRDAAKHFSVHELRVEEWARMLEDHGLIELEKNGDQTEMRKPE